MSMCSGSRLGLAMAIKVKIQVKIQVINCSANNNSGNNLLTKPATPVIPTMHIPAMLGVEGMALYRVWRL